MGRGPRDLSRQIARQSGSNFYYAFLFLPKPKREALFAVYAFCRHSDDIVDEARRVQDPAEVLKRWRAELEACYAGRPTHPITAQLSETIHRFAIPRGPFEALIDGVEMDLCQNRYATFDELYAYCTRVASAVGLICIEIFGYRNPRTRDYAERLGVAFQLTNILRDVGPDGRRGRIYLPREDLARFGVREEDLLRGLRSPAFVDLMRFQSARARDYYRLAAEALPPEDRRSLVAPEIMRAIYARLLRKIERSGFDVLGDPIRLSRPLKLALALGTWARIQLRP